MSTSVDFAIRNMTKKLPATVRAQAAMLTSKSVQIGIRPKDYQPQLELK